MITKEKEDDDDRCVLVGWFVLLLNEVEWWSVKGSINIEQTSARAQSLVHHQWWQEGQKETSLWIDLNWSKQWSEWWRWTCCYLIDSCFHCRVIRDMSMWSSPISPVYCHSIVLIISPICCHLPINRLSRIRFNSKSSLFSLCSTRKSIGIGF